MRSGTLKPQPGKMFEKKAKRVKKEGVKKQTSRKGMEPMGIIIPWGGGGPQHRTKHKAGKIEERLTLYDHTGQKKDLLVLSVIRGSGGRKLGKKGRPLRAVRGKSRYPVGRAEDLAGRHLKRSMRQITSG